jgi:hypothetical protein
MKVRVSDSSGERLKLDIQLATYVEIALVAQDDDTLKFIKDRVSELENRLRQISSASPNKAAPSVPNVQIIP